MDISSWHSIQAESSDKPILEAETARLARLIQSHTPHDGIFVQPIPGLRLGRFSSTGTDLKTFYTPSFGIVAQGTISFTVGQEVYTSSKPRIFMVPVALPITVQIMQASPSEPYLTASLALEPQRIAELAARMFPHGLPPIQRRSAGYGVDADPGFVGTMTRLVNCLQNPGDSEWIAPLVMEELLIRLLRSPIGVYVAEMGFADSGVQRVAKAIAWMRDNFAQTVKVEELARLAHMSASTFREHFKAVTAMSPLQFQKTLRLQEAKRLMLSGQIDAITASHLVGYVSDSQFSRDYSRFFGNPPGRDIARMRQQVQFKE